MLLRYVMYMHMIREIKKQKRGVTVRIRKWGIGDKTLFLSRSRTLKKFFARYDSVTNKGNVSIYDLQKYDLKYGLSFHIKIRVVSKVSFTMQNTIFFV